MLPEGWVIQTLESLASVKRGKFTPRPRNDPRYYGGEMPFVQTGDVTSAGKYLTEFSQTLNDEGVGVSKVFPPNSILITIAANIGHTAITTFDVACPDSVVGIQPIKDRCDVQWLKDVLETKREELDGLSTQNAQKNINLEVLRPLLLVTPPLPEQRRIAEILATWDRAIETVENLIANARAQKKALMQSLLTGKKRLPGFSGEWKEIKLREIGRCYNGVTYSPTDVTDKSGLLVLRSSNVQMGRLAFADNVYVSPTVKASCLTMEGDILICVRNGSRNLIGKTARITPDAIGHAHGAFMSLFRSTEPEFAWHLFQSTAYERQVNLNLGATINSINTSNLHKFKFLLPPKDERDQIALVLSAATGEIEILEKQHTALRQEKSALMQQLLTGKRRVQIELETAA